MSLPRRLAAALSAGALATVALAGCSGDPGEEGPLSGRIEGVRPADDGVVVSFHAVDLPLDAELRSESTVVELDGKPVPARAAAAGEPGFEDAARRVMLVLDTSGSMSGERIEGARAAAGAYLASVPADVEVGLLTFADGPTVVVAPTLDRRAVSAALPGLVARGGTSLYDAVVAAQEPLGPTGQRRLVVLTDGADTASGTSPDEAASALRGSQVTLDTVALGVEGPALPAVRRLTASGRGQVLRAEDALETTVAFRRIAGALSSRLQVAVPVAPELEGRDVSLTVRVDSTAGDVTARSELALPGVREAGFMGSGTVLTLGLAGFLLGLLGLLAVGFGLGPSRGDQRRRVQALLSGYTLSPGAGPAAAEGAPVRWSGNPVARGAADLAGRIVDERGLGERLTLRLDRADVSFTAGEWLVVQVALALAGAAAGLLLFGPVRAVLAGLVVGAAAQQWLAFRARRRARAFHEAMPDALQLVASGLATGYSLPQALDTTVREGQEPIAGEFGRALAEARLGVPLEDALDNVADRMDSKDFRWVVMAIRVQRGVGGNLSEVLGTVCATMRDRATLRRQVASLSAEGRLSAVVLVGLPVFMFLFQLTFRRDYFEPMLTRPIGIALLVACAVSLAFGSLVMKKIVKVEM